MYSRFSGGIDRQHGYLSNKLNIVTSVARYQQQLRLSKKAISTLHVSNTRNQQKQYRGKAELDVHMSFEGEHEKCNGKQYSVEELQTALFELVQVKGVAVKGSDEEQYVIGYCDHTVSFQQSLRCKGRDKKCDCNILVEFQVNVEELAALEAVTLQLPFEVNIKRKQENVNNSRVLVQVLKQSEIREQMLPFFIGRLAHVRVKLLPMVCCAIAARLQLDMVHLTEYGQRIWRFLQLGNTVVRGPQIVFEVYSGAVLSMMHTLCCNPNDAQLIEDLLHIIDSYEAWHDDQQPSEWTRSLRRLPSPIALTKPYFHGVADTAGSAFLISNKRYQYPCTSVGYQFSIVGEGLQPYVKHIYSLLNIPPPKSTLQGGKVKYTIRVQNSKSVLRIVELVQKDRGQYPFVRDGYFEAVSNMCIRFIQGKHRSEEGQSAIRQLYDSLKRSNNTESN